MKLVSKDIEIKVVHYRDSEDVPCKYKKLYDKTKLISNMAIAQK